MEAMSNLFEAMLIHAAPPRSGYMSSLCENPDEASINNLGFDGYKNHSTAYPQSWEFTAHAGFKHYGLANPCLGCVFQYNSCCNGAIISVHSSKDCLTY